MYPYRFLYLLPLALSLNSHAGDIPGFEDSRLEARVLAEGMPRPLELDVAPDGRVFFIELAGKLKIYHPATGEITVAATLDVFTDQENGLLGFALDPDFEKNGWLYLLHSPQSEVFSGQHLSRFTLVGDTVDLASEKILLTYEEQREQCCHHAGSVEFGPNGNLYISTGDNTHPFGDSGSYAPLDERPGRHAYDAQDSAGNTADLRGKILRIRPTPEGGYTIPAGNLFPPGGPIEGRPEIYVMGCRNPWRMNVDQKTGFVYWGDVGPDARGDGPRGPKGYDELNQARAAGNFGWPFFIGDNFPYSDHDYVTGKDGPFYDPKSPKNISPTNTGSNQLPPAQPAWIYYPYDGSTQFPMLGSGGRSACAGPVYHFDPNLKSSTKFPPYFDNCLMFYDWERTFVKTIRLDENSNIKSIDPFLQGIPFKRVVDLKFGPEGSLYVLDYGSTWGDNADSRLLRIDYFADNRPPTAKFTSGETVGKQPLKIVFSGKGSSDKDPGDTLTYEWSVEPGEFPAISTPEAGFTFTEAGEYLVKLTVRDSGGGTSTATQAVKVGNSPPIVKFSEPVDGGFFSWKEFFPYHVEINDAEDGNSGDAAVAMKSRFLMTLRYLPSGTESAEAAHLGASGKHLTAINSIKSSDCFNCHAIEHRVVGPAFKEIAVKYAGNDTAMKAAAGHIIAGSSKIWGDTPMPPHPQFSTAESRALVEWIVSLKEDSGGDPATQNLTGTITPDQPAWMNTSAGGQIELAATYTDMGAPGASLLTGRATVRLHNHQIEAEHFSTRGGIQTILSATASGGLFIGSISSGNHLIFDHINLKDIKSVTARVASPTAGGRVELRRGAPDGPLIATLPFQATGEWEKWTEVRADVTDPGGSGEICCIFINPNGGGPFMNLDWLRFDT